MHKLKTDRRQVRWTFLQRLARARRGAIGLALAAAVVPLVALLGIATDTARGYMVKARLGQALDAAGLAGAQLVQDPDAMGVQIDNYFNANFPPGFMGATVTLDPTQVDANQEVITLSAHAVIRTSFMRVLGFKTLKVSATTEVTRKTKYLDVVLAIDMSGSMDWSVAGYSGVPEEQKRIYAARNAAKELVNILFGDAETKELLKIGIVPWNAKVNVTTNGVAFNSAGTTSEAVPTFDSTPTYLNPSGGPQSTVYYANNSVVPLMSPPPSGWKGCVYSRFVNDGNDTNDADIVYGSLDSGAGDWRAWEPIGPEGEPVSGSARCALSVGYNECRQCLTHGVTRLTNVKQDVLDAITALTSPTGTTNATQGLGWAWRVLMPDTPFADALPDDEIEGERVQAIVLLTDGENWGGSGDGYKAIWGEGNSGAPRTNMDNRLRLLAANVKADGVLIYTIQFAFQNGPAADLLKEVASGTTAPYYHYAPDAETLKSVFKTVANNLSELRLSK